MNIPVLISNTIIGSNKLLTVDSNLFVKGWIRANSLIINNKPLEDSIFEAAEQAAEANKLFTWIKWSKYLNGFDPFGNPSMTDYPDVDSIYMGISYNRNTEIESGIPTDYEWFKLKGDPGVSGEGAISTLVSNTNFSFTSDFNGSITESSYSNAVSSISVLSGTNILKYSPTLNYEYSTNFTYILDGGEYKISDFYVPFTENEIYSALSENEWVVYSVKCNNILVSNFDSVVDPSSNREYVNTIHPNSMDSDSDTASIIYKILGKSSSNPFILQVSMFFSKVSIGPGVLYRGEFKSDLSYYDTNKRRDVVYFQVPGVSNYWITSNKLKNGFSNWDNPGVSDDWTSFGAEFSSIATGVIISEESYIKNTLNIGTSENNEDPRMTLYGADEFPFIAIGQSGSAMQWGATGIWLGVYNRDIDGDGEGDTKGHALSIGDRTSSLRWDGENLVLIGNMLQYNDFEDYGQDNPVGYVASTDYVDRNVAYTTQIISTNGTSFKNDIINTTLRCVVKKGNVDVTDSIPSGVFIWTRKSDNPIDDIAWNTYHSTRPGKMLDITGDDVDNRAVFECTVTIE